jgi:protein TonB
MNMMRVFDPGPAAPTLPATRWTSLAARLSSAAAWHAIGLYALVRLTAGPVTSGISAVAPAVAVTPPPVRYMIFLASDPKPGRGAGGGGGGNHQPGPIRRAQAPGHDNMTVRVARPIAPQAIPEELPALPQLALDAQPLASGRVDQIGLPLGGVSFGGFQGPGSGGGVGDGVGTGIGSGRGPGIGPGSGGGVYRAGGGVTAPRVLTEIKPTYTNETLFQKIQGSVLLELVVQADGRPADIRILRSLDPGLDEQAIAAAGQWRFEPGRRAGKPVDVLVTVMIDFRIR